MKKFKMLNLICDSCELTSKEKLVAHYFIYKSNKKGECYPAVSTIASKCGVSERTIQRATKKLQEEGFITIVKRFFEGKQTSNEYKLNTLLIDGLERNNDIEEDMEQVRSQDDREDIEIPFTNFEEELSYFEESNNVAPVSLQTEINKFEINNIEYDYDYDELDESITIGQVIQQHFDTVYPLPKHNYKYYINLVINVFIAILLNNLAVHIYSYKKISQLIYMNNILIRVILKIWILKRIFLIHTENLIKHNFFSYFGVSL